MNTNNLFCEIKNGSEIITQYYLDNKSKFDSFNLSPDAIEKSDKKILNRTTHKPIVTEEDETENYRIGVYYGFPAIEIKKRIWMQEPILNIVNKKFPIMLCGIIKVDANSMYDWHVDTDRGASINMLLSCDHYSKCLFFYKKNEVELKYKPNKFYIFNNQILHKVENFDQPRYMFTLQFKGHKNTMTYKKLYEWMYSNNFLNPAPDT
jgi:hypothetical protein